MRERIGVSLRIEHSINNDLATRLAIAKFAGGIGDSNPLWTDRDYANASAYQGLVAPPTFVLACFSGLQFGWPGLGAFHNATTLEFFAPIYEGDLIDCECVYEGFTGPQPSKFAGRVVVDHFRNAYRNQLGEAVATVYWSVMNYERGSALARANDSDVHTAHHWLEDELDEIEARVLAECPRGVTTRCWEDVSVGDVLDSVTKGPIGMTDEVAFVAGGGAPIPRLTANGTALRSYREHPAWAFRDPDTSALEPIYSVHYNRAAARAMGVPLQYDVGFQRQCWQVQLLTNWMGDEGWIKKADAQYRGFVYLSDVIELGGVVERKVVDGDGDAVVEVTTFARNQRDEDVMPGHATISLPAREFGPRPLARRNCPRGSRS
jgi:acyl dehydratase